MPDALPQNNETPFRHVNRRGVAHYIHAVNTGGEAPRYTMVRSPGGALPAVPDGYEVRENANGQVSIRHARPRRILPEEEALVATRLRELGRIHYRVEVRDQRIVIHEPDDDLEGLKPPPPIPSILPPEMRRRLEAETIEKFGQAAWDNYRRQQEEEFLALKARLMRFSPVLRFTLSAKGERLFVAEKVFHGGKGGWDFLDEGPLTMLVQRFLRHLGRDSFYELK